MRKENVFIETDGDWGKIIDSSTYVQKIDPIEITLGKSIRDYILGTDDSKNLEKINVVDGNKKFSSANGVLYVKDGKEVKLVPPAKTGSFVIPSGVKSIGPAAIASVKKIDSVQFNKELEIIKDSAFFHSSFIKRVDLSKTNVHTIEKSAFIFSPVEEVVFPSTLKLIGDGAFAGTNIKKILIPRNTEKLGSGSFGNCKQLESVTLESASTKIGRDTFGNCPLLREVITPCEKLTKKILLSAHIISLQNSGKLETGEQF